MTTITEQEFLDQLETIIDRVAKGDVFIVTRADGTKFAVAPYDELFLKFWREHKEETTATITIQMDADLTRQLEKILARDNLTIESAIKLFIIETVKQGKIPFAYTQADLEEANNHPLVTVIDSAK